VPLKDRHAYRNADHELKRDMTISGTSVSMESATMPIITKHLTHVQVAMMSLILLGCSSINTTEELTVSDAFAEVIAATEMTGDDNIGEEPSSALMSRSTNYYSARSNSVWISRVTVKDLAAQGVWDHEIESNNKLDTKSTRKSLLSQLLRGIYERPKVASRYPVSVGAALKEVLSDSNTLREPAVRNPLTEVTASTEMADEETDEESSHK
jgi:hypothetical protein